MSSLSILRDLDDVLGRSRTGDVGSQSNQVNVIYSE